MRSLTLVLCLITVGSLAAEIKTEVVEYEANGVKMKGYLAYEASSSGKRPGILVFHEWWGLNDYAKKRAEQLAAMGYVAFCADMYGSGKVTEHPTEAGKMAGMVRKNQKTWVGRAQAGLAILSKHERVDAKKLAAIGYCFGGSTALTLAYSGAPLRAVCTFHAALPVPTTAQAKADSGRLAGVHWRR